MEAWTFFGHRDAPISIEPFLRSVLMDLIEEKSVRLFYVGCQGNFDSMVQKQLEKLSLANSIQFYGVQAYLPQKSEAAKTVDHTLFPKG